MMCCSMSAVIIVIGGPAKTSVPRVSRRRKLNPLGAALVGVAKSIDDVNASLWLLRWDRWAKAKAGSDLVVDKLRVLKYWDGEL